MGQIFSLSGDSGSYIGSKNSANSLPLKCCRYSRKMSFLQERPNFDKGIFPNFIEQKKKMHLAYRLVVQFSTFWSHCASPQSSSKYQHHVNIIHMENCSKLYIQQMWSISFKEDACCLKQKLQWAMPSREM